MRCRQGHRRSETPTTELGRKESLSGLIFSLVSSASSKQNNLFSRHHLVDVRLKSILKKKMTQTQFLRHHHIPLIYPQKKSHLQNFVVHLGNTPVPSLKTRKVTTSCPILISIRTAESLPFCCCCFCHFHDDNVIPSSFTFAHLFLVCH